MSPRDIAGIPGTQKKKKKKKKNGELQIYSWERIRRRMVSPRDIAGNAEEEEEEW